MKAMIRRIVLVAAALMMLLPTAFAEHDNTSYASVILEDRDRGACRMLRGNINLTVVLVAADGKSWTLDELSEATATVSEALATLMWEAASHNTALNITPTYYRASASSDVDDANWRRDVIASVPELKTVTSWAHRPVLFILNTDGRSFARTGGTAMEYVVFYLKPNAGTVRHELLHLYGAEDFYFHDDLQTAAERHFPDSVMLHSTNSAVTDPLSAYLVGWTNSPDKTATAFLNDISHLTRRDVEDARTADQQSGTGSFKLTSGMYYGTLEFGCRNGMGMHLWADGRTYVGDWSWNLANGRGTIVWPSGATYTGDFINDERTGKGTYTWDDGTTYTGDFVDNNRTGKGTYTWPNGATYTGDFVDNNRTGKGTYTWPNGDAYTGDFVDNQRTGKGTYTWADGATYTGDFVNNKRTGMGTYTWTSGSIYTGDFVDGKRTGKGTYTWPDGSTYTGDFIDNVITGAGMMHYTNGNIYIGDFTNGERDGYGIMYYSDGSCKGGTWSHNAFVGE